jgi:HSP20 family protein
MLWPLIPVRRAATNGATLFETWLRDVFNEDPRMPAMFESRLPRADVAETDKEYLVTLELPGFDENEVEVKLTGSQLIVTGERKQKKEEKDKHFHRVETHYGTFERAFELPLEVRKDPELVKATFKKGMLEIRLPKAEVRPTAKIQVKST